MNKLPKISIVTPTWNSNVILFERVLKEVKKQNYPKRLIEHIVVDAQSSNGAPELAKKYGCKILSRPHAKNQELVQSSLGIKKAKGEIILLLQADNIITSNNWLREMVQPFVDNQNIVSTFSAYNSYEKGMNATTRYGALIGANDPTIYYLKKTEKIPMTVKRYDKGEILKETKGYYIVKFTKDNLPTIGDNGHMFSKKFIDKVNKDPQKYVHPDAFMQLLNMGYDTYGVVKNSIIHMITPNIKQLVYRRVQLKNTFYDERRGHRDYLVYNPNSMKDRLNLIKYVIISITLVIPLIESIKGYLKIRDSAWFLHPIICFLLVVNYGTSEILWQLKKTAKRVRSK